VFLSWESNTLGSRAIAPPAPASTDSGTGSFRVKTEDTLRTPASTLARMDSGAVRESIDAGDVGALRSALREGAALVTALVPAPDIEPTSPLTYVGMARFYGYARHQRTGELAKVLLEAGADRRTTRVAVRCARPPAVRARIPGRRRDGKWRRRFAPSRVARRRGG
jgi:hypothetical protein